MKDKKERWEKSRAKRYEIRSVWSRAFNNMPHSLRHGPSSILAQCLEISTQKVRFKHEQGAALADERWEMLKKLAHPEYGRVFAAIRLTALGVADQYDWGDK